MKDFLLDDDLWAIREAIRKIRAERKNKPYKPKPRTPKPDDGIMTTWKEVSALMGCAWQSHTYVKRVWKKWKREDGRKCPGKWVYTPGKQQKPRINKEAFIEYLKIKRPSL